MDVKAEYFIFSAPSIYENDDIKKGILLQLFGGTRKDFTHAGRGKFRYVNLNHMSCDVISNNVAF